MLNPSGIACAAMLTENGRHMNQTQTDKERAASAVFDELNEFARDRLPMGCSAEVAETVIRKGLKAVRNKIQGQPEVYEQRYGVPVFFILSMIPTLYTFIKWIVSLFSGEA